MKKNMSQTDSIIRIAIAAVVAVLFFTGTVTGVLGIVLMVAAGVFLLTGFVSFCPLYSLLRIKTRAIKKAE